MTLLATRTNFIKISGRYDLVVDASAWADNGADFYINSGMDWLDENYFFGHALSRSFQTLAIDGWYVLTQRCRALREVWFSTSTARLRLTLKPIEVVREWYAKPWSDIDSGTPLYYSPAIIRDQGGDLTKITIDSFGGTPIEEASKSPLAYNSVIISPPTKEAVELDLVGLFYSNLLADDSDENYWTLNYPMVAMWAALRELEVSHRNTTGVADWESAIKRRLLGLEHDLIDQEIAEQDQLEG